MNCLGGGIPLDSLGGILKPDAGSVLLGTKGEGRGEIRSKEWALFPLVVLS